MKLQQNGLRKILNHGIYFVTCIFIFICSSCHWLLDIAYKYIVGASPNTIDYKICAVIALAFIIFYLVKNKTFPFDFETVVLLVTLAYVGYLDYNAGRDADVCYWYILFSSYLLGRVAVGTNHELVRNRMVVLFLSLVGGMFVASFLDFSVNLKTGWAYGTETWPNFFSGDLERRTTYEFGFVLTTSLLGFAIFNYKKNRITSIFIIIANLFIQYCVIKVEGRENSFMAIISIFAVTLLYIIDSYAKFSNKTKKVLKILFICCICLTFLAIILWNVNFCGVKDLYLNSYLNSSGGILHNVRFKYDYDGFKAMLKYPFEDYEPILHIKRPHSTILEYGRVYNIIVYVGLLIFRLCVIKDAVLFAIKCKGENRYLKYMLIPAFVNINIYYSLEPNGYAHRHFLMAGLLISGIIRAYNEEMRE